MRKVIATLKALVEVMEALSKDAPEGVGKRIQDEVLMLYFISFVCEIRKLFLVQYHKV